MIIEQVPFSGIMDLDTANVAFQKGMHKHARNIEFDKGVAKNKKGTRKITYTLPAGTNICIGSFYDPQKQRVFWFNYNSNNNHGIYQMQNEVISVIALCAGTDYLNFSPNTPIHSVNILYGDETLGDVLKWIDSRKRPSKINITRALASGYGTIERSFLDVAKEPPLYPPVCAYANNVAATVNNLRKALYQFRYSYEFDDKEESALSTMSDVPLPDDYLDVNNEADPTKNSKITVTVNTGKSNVKKIKLYVRQNIGNVYGDYKLITTLDKAVLSIGNNTTYVYDFKNNIPGEDVDVKFSTLLFDYAPREANTQELVNGNIVAYGAIKEGYAKVTPTGSVAVDTVAISGGANDVEKTWNLNTGYKLGFAYFDEKGRTVGVVTSSAFEFSTGGYAAGTKPRVTVTVSHRPPVEAVTMQLVRSKNQSQAKFLNWITESTYKDTEYAYIGIQNLFNKAERQNILTYDFTPGDRVQFIKLGSTLFTGKDYEVYDFVNGPDVAGTKRNGFFLKIKLPTTGSGFDFGTGFGNYFINIYTPAVLDKTYWEFGEAWEIGNAGLSTRYHKGDVNQSTDLTTSAQYVLTDGDAYLKNRSISLGGAAEWEITQGSINAGFHTIGAAFVSSDSGNQTYQTGSSPLQSLAGGFSAGTDDVRDIIKTTTDAYTFRAVGVINLVTDVDSYLRIYLQYSDGTLVDLVPERNINGSNGGQYSFTFDKTFTVPANQRVFIMTQKDENKWINYIGGGKLTITNTSSELLKVIDANFSDTFASAVNADGRPLVEDENGEVYDPGLIRYSEAYQPGTNINKLNRFYPQNHIKCDRQRGDIQRFKVRGNSLHIFQTRGTGSAGIYQKMLTNADGSGNLMQSEEILSDVRYYQGDYGVGNQPCSLASSASADYFTDPVRGYHVRLAGDGLTPINLLYRAQYYLPPIAKQYLTSYVRTSGGYAKILGAYDFFKEEFITAFQAGSVTPPSTTLSHYEQELIGAFYTYFTGTPTAGYTVTVSATASNGASGVYSYIVQTGDTKTTIINALTALATADGQFEVLGASNSGNDGFRLQVSGAVTNGTTAISYTTQVGPTAITLGFSEKENAYQSFYDYAPEWITCAETTLVSWLNGEIYLHDSSTHNTFYGTLYPSVLDTVVNPGGIVVKEYMAFGYHSKHTWTSPTISTSADQLSNIVADDYRTDNTVHRASFGRDTNSIGGWSEGEFLKGQWLEMRLQNSNISPVFLYGLYVNIKT